MAKTIRLTIDLVVDNQVNPSDIILSDHDVIDGFEITRDSTDITDEFLLGEAALIKVEEIKVAGKNRFNNLLSSFKKLFS